MVGPDEVYVCVMSEGSPNITESISDIVPLSAHCSNTIREYILQSIIKTRNGNKYHYNNLGDPLALTLFFQVHLVPLQQVFSSGQEVSGSDCGMHDCC